MRKQITVLFALAATGALMAQTPRSAYHLEGFAFSHELNPAFQPESSYFSLPVFGNSELSLSSSLKMSDLLYDTSDGKITTFMSRGTIGKAELLDLVGDGWRQQIRGGMTLASWGFRRSETRYQTLSLSVHGSENLMLGSEYFNLLKDVENGSYDLSDARFSMSSYLALSAGESRRLGDHWTVGIKGKLLLGLIDMKLKIHDLQASLHDDAWTAQGHLELQAAGVAFDSETKEYNSLEHTGETYRAVTDMRLRPWGIHGLGLGMDAGASYQYDERLSFSASLLDLGFITWLGNKRAVNGGKPFSFNGFSDACLDEPDEYDNPDVYRPTQSIGNQMDRLRDDLMDLVHLEERGRKVRTTALAATLHLAATYRMPSWTFGALASGRLQGKDSWYEYSISASYRPVSRLYVTLSPNYSSFGMGMGGILCYTTPKGYNLYLGSDHLVVKTNKQLIPISLNGGINAGMTIPLR